MATLDQDAWIKDTFGEDPAVYANPASTAETAPAAAQIDPKLLRACATAGAIWLKVSQKVESDIGKLQEKFVAAFSDHELAGKIQESFEKRVRVVIDQFDDELAHKLLAISKGGDPSEHIRLVAEARSIIRSYLAYVGSDATLAELDKSPFMTLTLRPTLTTALSALSKTLA